MYEVGTWLSLVERTLGVGEVASSNLVVPTIIFYKLAFPIHNGLTLLPRVCSPSISWTQH